MKHLFLYEVKYEWKERDGGGVWLSGCKNIVANGGAEAALKKAKRELNNLEPDATAFTITSLDRICEVHSV